MKKKTENPFRTVYNRVCDYFTYNIVRRIFFVALVVVITSATLIQIFGGRVYLFGIFLISAAIGSLMIMFDLIRKKRIFVAQLRAVEADALARIDEQEGDESVTAMKKVFRKGEQRIVRKKKREYDFVIATAFLFTIILVVLFVQML